MSGRYKLLISLLIAVVLWILFTWPLARYFTSGIPATYRAEKSSYRNMMPGDHLQLLYRFWLASEVISGRTPVFSNVYEFNTGDDAARRRLHFGYFPLSLVYAGAAAINGRAFGWNVTTMVATGCSFLFTWLLVSRYLRQAWLACAVSCVAISLPYRWVVLLGGSPTGIGSAFIPMLAYGIDRAVRDGCLRGGILAGLAFFFCYSSDLHTFYFAGFLIPACCLFALTAHKRERPLRDDWPRILRALCPLIIVGVAMVTLSLAESTRFSGTDLDGGRHIDEVARFSPTAAGLLAWRHPAAPDNHMFLGYAYPLLILLGIVAGAIGGADARRPLAALLAVTAALVVIVSLALGTNGPLEGRILFAARKLAPKYDMIRQPDKIMLLAPTCLALAAGLAASILSRSRLPKPCVYGLVGTLCLASIIEHKFQIAPTISGLDTEQPAYAAIRNDAEARGNARPHALILPLWDGRSHMSSLYEHYASLYRIRMLNGYSATVPRSYRYEVVGPLERANHGHLSSAAIASLLDRGIEYLVFHDGLFSEAVAPFPATVVLKQLLANRHLTLLAQHRYVWSFRVSREARSESRPNVLESCTVGFPSRRWEVEKLAPERHAITLDTKAAGGAYVTLTSGADAVSCEPIHATALDPVHYMLRIRGTGVLKANVDSAGAPLRPVSLNVSGSGWQWLTIPVPVETTQAGPFHLRLACRDGSLDLDALLLSAGTWQMPREGETVSTPAACFFHSGYFDPQRNSVILTARQDAESIALFGPYLPLRVGRYRVTMHYRSAAAPGTELGRMGIWIADGTETDLAPILAGSRASVEFSLLHNLPVRATFVYLRNGDMEIQSIAFTLLSAPTPRSRQEL